MDTRTYLFGHADVSFFNFLIYRKMDFRCMMRLELGGCTKICIKFFNHKIKDAYKSFVGIH